MFVDKNILLTFASCSTKSMHKDTKSETKSSIKPKRI